MTDATFEDGAERPLRLVAEGVEDLEVLSSLVQDAIFPVTEVSWQPSRRRFGLLLNRFRWEDKDAAEARGRAFERVQSVLQLDDVLKVQAQGVDPKDKDMVLSVLSIDTELTEDGSGALVVNLAGDGAFRLEGEAINVTLQDVTRPYVAPSRKAPSHPD